MLKIACQQINTAQAVFYLKRKAKKKKKTPTSKLLCQISLLLLLHANCFKKAKKKINQLTDLL